MRAVSFALSAVLASSVSVDRSEGAAFVVPSRRSSLGGAATCLSSTASSTKWKKQPQQVQSRFERLKQTWKGPRVDYDAEVVGLDFGYADFDAAIETLTYDFNRDDVVAGTVVEYDGTGAVVDIGAKSSAYMPLLEAALIQRPGVTIEQLVPLQSELEVQIISEEDENGRLLVSVRRIQHRQAWERVKQLQDEEEVVEAEVISVNRGGAICLVEGLRAFLPGSHLAGQMATNDMIGQSLPLKFLEVNPQEGKLVVSNRLAVVSRQMSDLSRGDVVEGVVKVLKPYGAFVEVGGMSGLLHISQISYDRIEELEAVLQPEQRLKCMIIDHDRVNGRIALSTKTLEPEPGDMLRDPQSVYDKADETAAKYHERMEAERLAREEAAKDIVLGLGDSLDELTGALSLGDDDDDDDDEENDDEGSSSSSSNANAPADKVVNDPLAEISDDLDSLLA